MRDYIRNLSATTEFWLVMFVSFGLLIPRLIWRVATHEATVFDNRGVIALVGIELLQLAIVLWIGHIRGWSLATFGFDISWKWTGAGLLLFVVMLFFNGIVGVLAYQFHPVLHEFHAEHLSLFAILLVSLVNPVFEEVLEAGYFIHSLERFGMWPVVLASGLLRALLHTYQGFNGAVSALTVGVVFGLAYWRWRQLWPLIVAHALTDFLGLLSIAHATTS